MTLYYDVVVDTQGQAEFVEVNQATAHIKGGAVLYGKSNTGEPIYMTPRCRSVWAQCRMVQAQTLNWKSDPSYNWAKRRRRYR